MLKLLLLHQMGRLFEKRNKNETLPQHANDVDAPCSDGSKREEDEQGSDLGLVLLTEQEDQPYHKDEGYVLLLPFDRTC